MNSTTEPLLDVETDEASIPEFLDLICHPVRKPARKRSGMPQPIPTPSAMITVCGKSVEQAMMGVVAAVESTQELVVPARPAETVRVGGTSVSTDRVGRRTVVTGADMLEVM